MTRSIHYFEEHHERKDHDIEATIKGEEEEDNGNDTLELLENLREINQESPQVFGKKISKRQEQNRAAQRAFRQRKRDHLGELDSLIKKLHLENEKCSSEIHRLNEIIFFYKKENYRLNAELNSMTSSSSSSNKNEFCNALSELLDDNQNDSSIASSSTQLSFSPSQLWTITPIKGEDHPNFVKDSSSIFSQTLNYHSFPHYKGLKDLTKDPEMYDNNSKKNKEECGAKGRNP